MKFQVGTHDGVPNEGVGVVEVVEYSEGVMKRDEIGVSGGEVDEPACGVGVSDEAGEDHLRHYLIELLQPLATLQLCL